MQNFETQDLDMGEHLKAMLQIAQEKGPNHFISLERCDWPSLGISRYVLTHTG